MKNHHRSFPLVAILVSLAWGVAGQADNATAPLPPTNAMVLISVGPAPPARGASVPPVLLAGDDLNPAGWIDIKDSTSDMRAVFFAGFLRLEAKVNEQIKELAAIRVSMKRNATFKTWDFAMQEMGSARFQLKSTGELLSKATPKTWEFQKAKVGQAWARTQEAYGKVKACPID